VSVELERDCLGEVAFGVETTTLLWKSDHVFISNRYKQLRGGEVVDGM